MGNSELQKMMSKVVIDELSPTESEPSGKKSQDNKKTKNPLLEFQSQFLFSKPEKQRCVTNGHLYQKKEK